MAQLLQTPVFLVLASFVALLFQLQQTLVLYKLIATQDMINCKSIQQHKYPFKYNKIHLCKYIDLVVLIIYNNNVFLLDMWNNKFS